jgi:16S rRNA processing protein RimM
MSGMKKVGKIKAYHGLKGDLAVHIFSKDVSWLEKLTSFALGQENPDFKFEVERAKPFKEGLMLKPVGILDRTAAEKLKLKGMMFFIPEELLVADEGEDIFLSQVEGFEVFEKELSLGEIVGFQSTDYQDLMQVKRPNGAISEVPFVDQFIKSIDFEKRQVLVELPDGLLEINQ